jgi:hypothetical protein
VVSVDPGAGTATGAARSWTAAPCCHAGARQ